jgi:TolA-binding protein
LVPGETRTGVITVDNKGSMPTNLMAYVTDVGMSKTGDLSFPEGGSLPFSCEPWIIINPESFSLSQGASQQVRYTLKVPLNAAGSYVASIFFQTKPSDRPFATGSAISARIGTLVVVSIIGRGQKDAELTVLGARQSADRRQTQIELGIKNKGNALLRPGGTVELKNEAGWTVEKFAFNEDKQAVLPYSERVFQIPLPGSTEPGNYKLYSIVDYGGRELLSAETKVNLVAAAPTAVYPGSAPERTTAPATAKRDRKPAGDSQPSAKASPEEIKSLYSQGSRLYSSGDYQGALAVWQKLLKLDPGNSAAAKNLERTKSKLEALKRAKG